MQSSLEEFDLELKTSSVIRSQWVKVNFITKNSKKLRKLKELKILELMEPKTKFSAEFVGAARKMPTIPWSLPVNAKVR